MTYQIALLQLAKTDEVTLETFPEMVSYVEKMNYQHLKAGKTGQLLVVKQYSDGQLIRKQFVPIGYGGYTEELLAEFEVEVHSRLYRFKKRMQALFNRLRRKGRKKKMTTESKNEIWKTNTAPSERQLTPDEERARIAAKVSTDSAESAEIDYGQAYQEEVVEQQSPTISNDPSESIEDEIDEVEAEAEAVFGRSDQQQPAASPAPVEPEANLVTSPTNNLLDPASLSQEKLLNHLAVVAQERSQIRQKILDNQVLIDQAKRLEIENENLELEYRAQEIKFQKLQQFNALFEELREYLQ